MNKLLPCPFCGNELEYDDLDTIYPVNHQKTQWQVACHPGNGGCDVSVFGVTIQDAVKRWNTRK